MNYRNLGRSGLKVSEISLGSWVTYGQGVDDDATEACLLAAYEAGINFFDGAEAYGDGGAEEAMGKVLRKHNWRRDSLVLSGKVMKVGDGPNQQGLSRKHLFDACEATLERFGVDYVDLFFCHRPDPSTPIEETVRAMNELIQRGKILYWGTSSHSANELWEIYALCDRLGLIGPTMEQPRYSMLSRDHVEEELKPFFEKFGLGSTVWSPLAFGILTGKYNDGVPKGSRMDTDKDGWFKSHLTEPTLEKARALTKLAEELGVKTSQLALAWVLNNPNVSTAIIGATKPEQVIENAAASEVREKLTPNVLQRIQSILERESEPVPAA